VARALAASGCTARRNFGELYAVFDTPRLITVRCDEPREHRHGRRPVLCMSLGEADQGPASFTLAGRPWRVTGIEWGRGVCHVAPAEDARSARWSGSPRFLGPELCRAIRSILVSDDHDMSWSKRARAAIDQAREEHAFLRGDPSPIVAGTDGLTWWNHAGGRANILLAQILEHALGGKVTARDASLTCKGEASRSEAGLRSVLRSLHEEGRPSGEDARVHAQGAARSRVSKFEPCLPETLLCDLLAARVVDVDGARAALAAFASS
jgi:ATP-dependent Lhr-like helicase